MARPAVNSNLKSLTVARSLRGRVFFISCYILVSADNYKELVLRFIIPKLSAISGKSPILSYVPDYHTFFKRKGNGGRSGLTIETRRSLQEVPNADEIMRMGG